MGRASAMQDGAPTVDELSVRTPDPAAAQEMLPGQELVEHGQAPQANGEDPSKPVLDPESVLGRLASAERHIEDLETERGSLQTHCADLQVQVNELRTLIGVSGRATAPGGES